MSLAARIRAVLDRTQALEMENPMPLSADKTQPIDQTGAHVDPEDTGTRMRLAEAPERTVVVTCAGCNGQGRVTMPIGPILRESLGLLGDQADAVMVTFYGRLFESVPDLVALFPPDLLTAKHGDTASRGAVQRDKLVTALATVASLYGGTVADQEELDNVLAQAGRSHANFWRAEEGVSRGATLAEYLAVKRALFETLHAVAGDKWRPEYDVAWDEAFEHARVVMEFHQRTGGRYMTTPRQARQARED